MRHRQQKTVLFLAVEGDSRSRSAEVRFNEVAGKIGLSWRALSGLVVLGQRSSSTPNVIAIAKTVEAIGACDGAVANRPPFMVTADDLNHTDLVVALGVEDLLPMLREQFPDFAGRVEYCGLDDTQTSTAQIEREVMALVARLLGGVERQEDPVIDAPAAERLSSKEAAKKLITLKVGRETSGRRGRGVTTVFDLPFGEDSVRELAALLKQRCGTGGTVKDGRIEIQGDQRERVAAELENLGYKVKRVGG
jgi:translation initiation factor 1